MPRAKPAVQAPPAPPAPAVPPTDADPADDPADVPEPVMVSGDKLKVKNTSNRNMNLTHGSIKPDKVGTATWAEYLNFTSFLERV